MGAYGIGIRPGFSQEISCEVTVAENGSDAAPVEIYPVQDAIVVISSLSSGKKEITVKYESSVTDKTAYEVRIRKGNENWKTYNTLKTKYTIKKLKRKKVYSVQVRAYQIINGYTYYSNWSGVKKVKVK